MKVAKKGQAQGKNGDKLSKAKHVGLTHHYNPSAQGLQRCAKMSKAKTLKFITTVHVGGKKIKTIDKNSKSRMVIRRKGQVKQN